MAWPVRSAAAQVRLAALAEIHGHAAKGALEDLAVVGAREGHAPMLELVHGLRGAAAEILDGVLIAEPVGPLHRIVHVPAPVVGAHIAERRGDAALGGDGVERVGKTLVMQAVRKPASLAPTRREGLSRRRPTTTTS